MIEIRCPESEAVMTQMYNIMLRRNNNVKNSAL